ncbi:hypothetical protein [Roseateles sp. LYH14W]|uniref:Uncharacterized protein n=1 Tax=Pelomonas parva TaxID=3299032 RepID=A0ABW7F1T5_9BURK
MILAVLMAHAAVLLLLWQGRRSPVGGAEASQALVLRLVPPPSPRRTPVERPQAVVVPVEIRVIVPPEFVIATGAVASPDGATATVGAHGVVPSPAQPASSSGPLNLRPRIEVLRGALANPATTDPRSNSPRPTFEERIAMGLDPDLCVKLERDAQGLVTRRMGRMARTLTHLQATQGAGAKDVRTCQ